MSSTDPIVEECSRSNKAASEEILEKNNDEKIESPTPSSKELVEVVEENDCKNKIEATSVTAESSTEEDNHNITKPVPTDHEITEFSAVDEPETKDLESITEKELTEEICDVEGKKSQDLETVDESMSKAAELPPPPSPSSSSSTSKNNDCTFEPTVDMMVNDFDDEATLEEEEALAAKEAIDPSVELSSLEKEKDMPIEELLALYNCAPPIHNLNTAARRGTKRGGSKKRQASSTSVGPAVKKEKKSPPDDAEKTVLVEEKDAELVAESDKKAPLKEEELEDDIEDEEDDEAEAGTLLDDDDDDDDDSKEISDLRKLYPETYGKTTDKRLLRTLSRQQSEEDEDNDYSPDEDDVKKTIMIGSAFQAVIPEGFVKYDDALPYENEDKLLWDPCRLSEEQTEEYLKKAEEQGKPSKDQSVITIDTLPCGKHLRDNEQALYLLLQCGHNAEEALRRKRINPVPPTDQMSVWSEEECRNFESVIRLHGKDFHTIKHAKVHTRSVGELVQFYYLWKKTERHDVFANKARLEKKKYNLNPGLTDYMDKFLEELDSSNTNQNNSTFGDRSSSPSSTANNTEEGATNV